jgi:uncharacterized protein (DUF2062 family)
MTMTNFAQRAKSTLSKWMREGMSPSRLAVTLALGFSIGCLPITGVPTVLCLTLAFLLHLNLPVIQTANYIAWPVQLIVALPMVRLGRWILLHLLGHEPQLAFATGNPSLHFLGAVGSVAANLMIGWLVALGPAILILTLVFRTILRRIPLTSQAVATIKNC